MKNLYGSAISNGFGELNVSNIILSAVNLSSLDAYKGAIYDIRHDGHTASNYDVVIGYYSHGNAHINVTRKLKLDRDQVDKAYNRINWEEYLNI